MRVSSIAICALFLTTTVSGQVGSLGAEIASAAEEQVGVTVQYDPAYVRLAYPGGDVPPDRGVCTDVVIRALREVGIDLQVEVHEDIKRNFEKYPNHWGLERPDRNIDHRRVPNLMRWFERAGHEIGIDDPYEPGDVVAWMLPSNLYHIGIVSTRKVPGADRPLIIHNIGRGTESEDILHEFRILGHYRLTER